MRLFSFIFLFLIISAISFAQKKTDDTPPDRQIKGVIIAGVNISQVDGDEVFGFYKFGANAGVGALVPLGKNFFFGIETLYNQKGAYKRTPPAGDSTGKPYYKLNLDYLDVPALVYYEDRHLFTVGLGFSYGRRVNYHEIERGILQDSASRYSKNDWDVIADLQLRVWHHLKVDLRYSYSLAKLRTRNFKNASGAEWTRDQYHNIITLRAIYLLNEKYKPPPKTRKKKTKTSTAYIPTWTQ